MAKERKRISFEVKFVTIILILLLLGYLGLNIYQYFVPVTGIPIYNQRLDDLVEIDQQSINNAVNTLNAKEEIKNVKVRNQGPIVYIIVDVNQDVSAKNSEKLFGDFFENFSEQVINEYDFQFIVTNTSEELAEGSFTNFPHFGAKSNLATAIKWQELYRYEVPLNCADDEEEVDGECKLIDNEGTDGTNND